MSARGTADREYKDLRRTYLRWHKARLAAKLTEERAKMTPEDVGILEHRARKSLAAAAMRRLEEARVGLADALDDIEREYMHRG